MSTQPTGAPAPDGPGKPEPHLTDSPGPTTVKPVNQPNQPELLRPTVTPVAWSQALTDISVEQVHGRCDPAPQLSGITLDSRLVRPGDLYVALPGATFHGARFVPQAVAAGAVAVLTDPAGVEQIESRGVPVIEVADPRTAMAEVAANIYRHPARQMAMYAITGTNGKTTTAYLVQAMLRAAGQHAGTVGTIGFRLDDTDLAGARTTVTTPESPELQGLLGLFAERGADAVAMEVSSHAVVLQRVGGIRFDMAAFTNLGRDHLDFHHTMEEYFEAKAGLFTAERTRRAVVNVDDPWGRQLAERIRATGTVELTTTGWSEPADFRILGRSGARVTVATPKGERSFDLAPRGDYNVRNAVTALAMLTPLLSVDDLDRAVAGLATVQIPGRMQRVELPGGPLAIVDFAHTPQAVSSALSVFAADRAAGTTVIAVVGCGGDRDRTKREPMGAAAAAGADLVVVTDDNPRTEDPAEIRARVIAGARAEGSAEVIDGGARRDAIATALSRAAAQDGQSIVVVLGKGHEKGQEINQVVTPFDDSTVLAQEWAIVFRQGPEGGSR